MASPTPPPRPATRRTAPLGLLLALLLAPLAWCFGSARRGRRDLLRRPADEGCISGTIRTEDDVRAPTSTSTSPGPAAPSETVDQRRPASGASRSTEPGAYTPTVDEETLPEGIGRHRRRGHRQGQHHQTWPQAKAVTFGVRTGDYSDVDQQDRPAHPEHLQRAAARPAARAGVGRPVADLRHDRSLQLRARRAGDPGRHARLLRGQPVGLSTSGSAARSSS